jgi:hypothetical protein
MTLLPESSAISSCCLLSCESDPGRREREREEVCQDGVVAL